MLHLHGAPIDLGIERTRKNPESLRRGDRSRAVRSSLPDTFRRFSTRGVPLSPRKSERPHRAALTRMLRATGLVHMPDEAPLVELLRSLADEIDAGGGSRPRIEYRNALKDARAVLDAAAKPRRTSTAAKPRRTSAAEKRAVEPETEPTVAPKVVSGQPDNLLQFEQRHGIA